MKLKDITSKIIKRISEYVEFDVNEIFAQSYGINSNDITIYGGAVRDSIAGLEIHDVDILCMSKSAEKLRQFLINCKNYKTLELYDLDALNMYKGIPIILEPWTLINKNNKIIQIIRPSFGPVNDNNYEKQYQNAYYNLIKNVDLSCCGVFIEKNINNNILLKEACKNSIVQCFSKTFEINKWSLLYNTERTNYREYKLSNRGWINLEREKDKFININDKYKIKIIKRKMKIMSIELKSDYDYKIWSEHEYYIHNKDIDIENEFPF